MAFLISFLMGLPVGVITRHITDHYRSNCTCGEPPTPPTMKVEQRDFHSKNLEPAETNTSPIEPKTEPLQLNNSELKNNDLKERIFLFLLTRESHGHTLAEIMSHFDMQRKSILPVLRKLVREERVEELYKKFYPIVEEQTA